MTTRKKDYNRDRVRKRPFPKDTLTRWDLEAIGHTLGVLEQHEALAGEVARNFIGERTDPTQIFGTA